MKTHMEATGLPADNLADETKVACRAGTAAHRRTLIALGRSEKPPTRDQLQAWAKKLQIDLDASLDQLAEAELVFLDEVAF